MDFVVVDEYGDGLDDGEIDVVEVIADAEGVDPAVSRVEGASRRKLCVF